MLIFKNKTKDEIVASLNSDYISEKRDVITRADRLLEGIFIFQNEWDMERFSEEVKLDLENIEWNFIPKTDMEWSYMFHRHGYLMDLILAYAWSGEKKYYNFLLSWIEKWILENEYSNENKKYSWRTLDTAIRVNNWLRIKELCLIFNIPWPESFDTSIDKQVRYLSENLQYARAQSNWTVMESIAVILYTFDQKIFDEKYERAVELLKQAISLQILEDGLQWEQSPMYHHQVLISLLLFIVVHENNRKDYDDFIFETALKMHQASIKIMQTNGMQPNLGDSDIEHMGSLMLACEKILKQASFIDHVDSSLFDYLLTGNSSDSTQYRVKQSQEKYYLRESGIASIHDNENDSSFLFCVSPQGGGHGHDDYLHFNWLLHNQPFFLDSGRYTYDDNSSYRLKLKSALAHNTIVVDNKSYNHHINTWDSCKIHTPMNEKVLFGKKIDYFEGGHLGYSDNDQLRYVNRQIILINSQLFIFDSIISNDEVSVSSNFILNQNNLYLDRSNKKLSFPLHSYIFYDFCGEYELEIHDWKISLEYNKLESAKRLTVSDKLKDGILKLGFIDENVDIELLDVYDDFGERYSKRDVTCAVVSHDNKQYGFLIQHREPSRSRRAYHVNDYLFYGRCVYFELVEGKIVYEEKVL